MSEGRRVAVITGGAQGIGRRTAELMTERGYSVALIDLRMPDETIRSVEKLGGEAMGFAGNITDEGTVEKFADAVFDRFGRADVLVNNAGISLISPAEKTSAQDYRHVLEVNLVAPFLLAKAFGSKDARGGPWLDRERGVSGRFIGYRRSRCLQCLKTWIDRTDTNAGRGMGWTRRARERRLPWLGENGDGRRRPGARHLR